MVRVLLVTVFLGAIVAANLISAHYGPGASIYNAFFLIGLDLTTRDRLHDFWGENRWPKMAALILSGSALSYLAAVWLAGPELPHDVVLKIAVASAVAFAASGATDAVVYHLFRNREWFERANISNVASATVDSVVFVTLAFGFMWPIIFGQICAKIAGGFIWSFALARLRARKPVTA